MNPRRYINHREGQTGWMRESKTETTPAPPLGEFLGRLRSRNQDMYFPEKTDGSQEHVGISDVELIASYNWVKKSSPTIIVPGKPPRWTPLSEPRQLVPDDPKGTYYRDPNAASYPKHPMEPAVTSVMEMRGECPGDLQLFACGSTLGNLLRFCRNSYDSPFRMLVNVIGNVVHLVRRENSPTDTIPDVYGYGHTFPDAYTSWDSDVRQSTSHQRVIRYKLGDIDALIRFEVDGYLPQSEGFSPPGTQNEKLDPEDLASLLGGLAVASGSGGNVSKGSRLSVENGGKTIPQSRVFDLKTRSLQKKREINFIFDQEIPRLWLRQMPNFVLAFHKRGVFNDVEVHEVNRKLVDWERDHQFSIRSLVKLLQDIMRMAKDHPDGKFEIVYPGGGPLEIREQLADAGDMLSDQVRGDWERWLSGGRPSSRGGRNGDDNVSSGDVPGEGAAVGSVDATGRDAEKHAAKWESDSESDSGDLTACGPACDYCGKCSH